MKTDKLYLIHIQECIARIEAYTRDGKGYFFSDIKTQDAVLRNLQTMAESSQRVSEETKLANPEIDWRAISGFRNALVHDYLGINLTVIWSIIQNDIPILKRKIEILLK